MNSFKQWHFLFMLIWEFEKRQASFNLFISASKYLSLFLEQIMKMMVVPLSSKVYIPFQYWDCGV